MVPCNIKDQSLSPSTFFSLLLPVPSPPCQTLSHVGTFTIRLLQTTTFQNTSFVHTEGLGLLEDIELGSLDKHTWSIHFYQPWVRPALPQSDWDTIDNLLKIYFPSCNLSLLSAPPDPFVAQCMAGCELYPNRTSRTFAYVGYNGQDFLSFDTENASWTLSQDTNLSRYVWSVLQNYTTLSELVEVLFNDTCVDDMEVLLNYGRAALERQELPVATVFARIPSLDQLLLVCHVTGFYPRPISVAWLQDGHEVPPGPCFGCGDKGESLTALWSSTAKLLLWSCQILSALPQGFCHGASISCPPLISESTSRWRNRSPGTPS
uniref:Ig-like domain-containing protein n=1 Tax=Malurus cyaneus samueli TaxID=2593467 RepID=A0A8C5TEE7_9PASS